MVCPSGKHNDHAGLFVHVILPFPPCPLFVDVSSRLVTFRVHRTSPSLPHHHVASWLPRAWPCIGCSLLCQPNYMYTKPGENPTPLPRVVAADGHLAARVECGLGRGGPAPSCPCWWSRRRSKVVVGACPCGILDVWSARAVGRLGMRLAASSSRGRLRCGGGEAF